MARRGRCRCGLVLKFQKGPEGYKTRCPSCGSVVRLQPVAARSTAKKKKTSKVVHSAPPSEVPAHEDQAAEPGPKAGRIVTCEVCFGMVPAEARQCPDCGAELARTVAAPALGAEQGGVPSTAGPRAFSNRLIFCCLMASAALLIATLGVVLFWRR